MQIINIVVTTENIDELPALVEFVNSMGYYASIVPALLSNTTDSNDIYRDYAPELAFGPEDNKRIREIFTRLISMKKNGYKVFNSNKSLEMYSNYLRGENPTWKCDAGILYYEIHPNGDYSTCAELSPAGNILHDDFLTDLQSKEYRLRREKEVSACKGCMWPCYAEVSNMTHSTAAFTEKVLEHLRLLFSTRKCEYQPERISK